MAQTVDEVRASMESQYRRLVPTLNVSQGAVERDIFLEAPLAGAIMPMWQQIGVLEGVFSLFSNPEAVPATLVDQIAENYNVSRTQATSGFGIATFYATAFNSTITISAGSAIQTASTAPVTYVTISSAVFNPQDAGIYFNATANRYEFKVAVKSQNTGAGTGVAAGALSVLVSPIAGIAGVTNAGAIDSGNDAESNTQVVAKIQQANVSRSIDTTAGLGVFLSGFSNDYLMVKYGEDDFKRSNFPGGVDVYFANIVPETFTETFTVPASTYVGAFLLTKQPVISVDLVVGDVSGTIAPTKYSLTKDTGLLGNSVKAKDAVNFGTPGITEKTVTVTYTYNSFPETINDQLTLGSNDIFNRDVLIRQAYEVEITLKVSVRLQINADIDLVRNSIVTGVSSYINSLAIGQSVLKSIVLDLLRVDGVAGVDYSTFVLTPEGGGSVNANGDVQISSFEFAVFKDSVVTPI